VTFRDGENKDYVVSAGLQIFDKNSLNNRILASFWLLS